MEEVSVSKDERLPPGIAGSKKGGNRPVPLSSVESRDGSRFVLGIPEFDRVLGGGSMKRSAVLIGGAPGIGKSTLLLQAAQAAQTNGRVLYVSRRRIRRSDTFACRPNRPFV